MSTSVANERIGRVHTTDDGFVVAFADGRTMSVPLDWYPRLLNASAEQRSDWRLIGEGEGIHWPQIDEDLSAEGLLSGVPALGARLQPSPVEETQDNEQPLQALMPPQTLMPPQVLQGLTPLTQEAVSAYSDFLSSAFSFYQQTLQAATQIALSSMQAASQATQQGVQAASQAAQQSAQAASQAGQQAAETANQTAQQNQEAANQAAQESAQAARRATSNR